MLGLGSSRVGDADSLQSWNRRCQLERSHHAQRIAFIAAERSHAEGDLDIGLLHLGFESFRHFRGRSLVEPLDVLGHGFDSG